jgi:hypothetical protein
MGARPNDFNVLGILASSEVECRDGRGYLSRVGSTMCTTVLHVELRSSLMGATFTFVDLCR